MNLARFNIRIEKDIVTRVTRTLSGKGELSVKEGQEVSPDEIIGTSISLSGFRILNVARELNINPREVNKFLTKKINQTVYKGELIALKKGLFGGKKVITSPTDGIIDFLNPATGELKISFLPKKINLPAGVYGIIEKTDKERGQVVIRTQACRVRGVFGTGRQRDGILHIMAGREALIGIDAVKDVYAGRILAGGGLFFRQAISQAISCGVKGIITGGINASDWRAMAGGRIIFPKKLDNDVGVSMVVCEGFGAVPLAADIFGLLSAFEGKFIFIDGNKGIISLPSYSSSIMEKVRKTALPPLENNENAAVVTELKTGSRVRVVGNSYFAYQGKLLAINKTPTLLASKLKTIMALVETPAKKIEVPVANLEAIV